MSEGSCLNDALSALVGYDIGLPDWVPGDQNQVIAEQLGLRYIEEAGPIELEEEDTVFVVPTTGDKAHAIYVPSGKVGVFLEQLTRPILCIFLG